MIIIPSNKFVDSQDALPSNVGVEGWFTLKAVKGGRTVREISFEQSRRIGPFHNLLLDAGLDRFGSNGGNSTFNNCVVGLGTTPPSVADTGLASFLGLLASLGSSTSGGGSPEYWASHNARWQSSIGQLGNNNITEVGVGWGINGSDLFSRELIRDSLGNPVAFPILSDEQLEVTYQLRIYPPLGDSHGTVTIGSTVHDVMTRAWNINTQSNWSPFSGGSPSPDISTISGYGQSFEGDAIANDSSNAPSGHIGNATSRSMDSYIPGDLFKDGRVTFGTGAGNGSIRVVTVNHRAGRFQHQFDPPIVKNNTQILHLDVRYSWARR